MPPITFSRAVKLIVFALLPVLLATRANLLYTLYANAPSRLKHVNNLDKLNIRFKDQLRNCEDVVLDSTRGIALLSCDPARDSWNTVMGTFVDSKTAAGTGLYIWHYSKNESPRKLQLDGFENGAGTFHPLGIHYEAQSRVLYAVNHAPQGSSIEIFDMDLENARIRPSSTVVNKLLAAPNSITALSSTELLVTVDHHFLRRFNPVMTLLETYLGMPGGRIVHVDLTTQHQPVLTSLARVSFANGIAVLNDSTIAVASSSQNTVYLFSLTRPSDNAAPTLARIKSVSVPFHPDNLSVDQDGKLLVAGHPHSPTLEKIAHSNARCHSAGVDDRKHCEKGLSWIAEWDEVNGLRTLYVGQDYGTSTTAARDVGRGFAVAVGLYERGVMVWNG